MSAPRFRVVAPYRFNPLGAHIDHQGGAVLARTIDRHTALVASPLARRQIRLMAGPAERGTSGDGARAHAGGISTGAADVLSARFDGELDPDLPLWQRYALGAAVVLHRRYGIRVGLDGEVSGSMIAAGLSSSASYLLAMFEGLAHANGLALSTEELVDCVREVEHEHLGLTNGIQDQLSIASGRAGTLVRLDVNAVSARYAPDPERAVRWLLCYSGVSRELVGSGYNTPVTACIEAAGQLHPGATRLGDVPLTARDTGSLPEPLARRARHVYGEMERVDEGFDAWTRGDVERFGALMNASCQSSIESYGSGSEWLVALHEIALATPGVHGNRFSGGGYGGCLVMLIDAERADEIGRSLVAAYADRYPEEGARAFCFLAGAADGVRIESLGG